MKKICIALLASLACLFVVSCERQEEGNASVGSSKRFRIEAPQFLDENGQKVHLQFSESASNLIYDEGDIVYINGCPFSMTKSEGVWYATSDTAITAERFLVTYVDGDVPTYDSASSTYGFNMNDNLDKPAHNKAILGGVAENNGDYVISLKPACAILRIDTKGAGANYDYIKVGFDGNAIPKQGTINVSNRTLSAGSYSNYMNGVAQGGGGVITGDFLYMTRRHAGESDYWYVAIPIEGSSVTTTLYLEWTYNGGAPVQRKTQAPVTMYKGYVYTLGTERRSPFTANGVSNCSFLVSGGSGGKEVLFSAGNLQAQRYRSGSTYLFKWRFAEHQYDVIGSSNSTNITVNGSWFDLFGYATSGYDNGQTAYAPNSTSSVNGDYFNGNINGTNSDWGRYIKSSPGIYYGSTLVTSENWRTLTNDEWSYLMGRSGKVAFATIAGTYKGVVLLPDYDEIGAPWNYAEKLPSGPSFTAGFAGGYTTNSYTASEWDALEAAGAIFIPVTGLRNETAVSNISNGYYWSSSIGTAFAGNNRARSHYFDGSTCSAGQNPVHLGLAVRLVIEIAK